MFLHFSQTVDGLLTGPEACSVCAKKGSLAGDLKAAEATLVPNSDTLLDKSRDNRTGMEKGLTFAQ